MSRLLGSIDASPDLKTSLMQLRASRRKPTIGNAQKEIMRMGAEAKARKAASSSKTKNKMKNTAKSSANMTQAAIDGVGWGLASDAAQHFQAPSGVNDRTAYVGAAALSPAKTIDINDAVVAPWKVWPKITKAEEGMTAAAPGSLVLKKSIHEKGAKTAAMWTVLKVAQAVHDPVLEKAAAALPTQTLDQDVRSLISIQKNLQQQTKDEPDDSEIDKCVDDKKKLTGKIVTARKSQRGAQTQAATAKSRKDAIDGWVKLVESQKSALKAGESDLKTDWKPLSDTIDGGDYAATFDDSLTELDGIDSEVKTYIETDGAPLQATTLPMMLKGVRKTLDRLKEDVLADTKGILDNKGNLQITYAALKEQLDKKKEALEKEKTEMTKSYKEAETDLKAHVADEKDLMTQRTAVEERCETSLSQIKASFKQREEELGALDLALRVLQSKSEN